MKLTDFTKRLSLFFLSAALLLSVAITPAFSEHFKDTSLTVTDPRVYLIIIFSLLFSFCVYWSNHESKKRLDSMILTDEMTNLSTLKKFKSDIRRVLKHAKHKEYAVISLDINNFHYITESFGQDIGNSVLIELAQHLKDAGAPEDLLCRNFVDNFFAFTKLTTSGDLSRIELEDKVSRMTNIKPQLRKILPEHYQLEFSMGVYVITDPSESVEQIIEKANVAREIGKKSLNPNRISFYTSQMGETTALEKDITFDMNSAFENHEFIVYYQPKYRFSDQKIIGAEALIRWNHKTKGLMPPNSFVPLFERNGFIQKIDIFVFERVCAFLDEWNHSCSDGKCPEPITISCNLSRMQLYNPDIAKRYAEIASQYQIYPSKIEIELTESIMLDNKNRLLKAMNEIKKAGFQLSVDDFGSGYSSLNLLKDIPADVIKLDKEFLNTTENNTKENIIIHSVIDMAKKLNMETVAEGIENQEQSDLLKSMGCDIVQGFYYAKPMPEDKYKNLLHSLLG
jgi:diguanylate cyclase (GGDEF)-like protein